MDLSADLSGRTVSAGYRALHQGAAALDLSARGKIRASGEDRARLLHAMSTNRVQELQPGDGCYTFFLNAQGRILCDANLFCFGDYLLLDVEPETRTNLYEHLDRYIIADDVALEDQTESLATVGVEGPEASLVLKRLGAPLPEIPYRWTAWGGRIVAAADSTGAGGFRVFLPASEKADLLAELAAVGALEANPQDARIVRIEHGRPRYGEEITERYLVQETGQMHAVNFNKGCYLGQEIVERVRSRAQIHRVLMRLQIDANEPPSPGVKLKAGDADAAEIASAVFSPALGKVVALAYVRTQYAEAGAKLSLDSASAEVIPAAA
ncbi:MAG TPA: glycine cleavage T C-terminal barrel domain-containing protein [Bryobacteraceae bacterium]